MDKENDYMDKLCYEYFRDKKEIPMSTKNTILHTCKNINNYKHKYNMRLRVAITCLSLCMIVTTIAFSKDIIKFTNISFFGGSKGVQTAIDNNFIGKVENDFIYNNGIGVKISNIIMDDKYLGLQFNIDMKEKKVPKDVNFEKMIIYDENNIILYCSNSNFFEKFCKEKGLDYTWENTDDDKFVNSGVNSYFNLNQNNESLIIDYVYNLYSDGYPKSKKIYVDIENIDIDYDSTNEKIKSIWNLEVDIPEKIYNRENIIYKSTKENNVEVKNIIVGSTNTTIEFVVKNVSNIEEDKYFEMAKELLKQGKTSQEITDIINEIRRKNKDSSEKELFNNVYIQNEKGEKFYQDSEVIEGNRYVINQEENKINVTFTFELTKYDNITNQLYLHFEFNNKEYNILLNR